MERRTFLSSLGLFVLASCGISGELLGSAKFAKAETTQHEQEKKLRLDPERQSYVLPAGAQSYGNFHHHCIGCMLCVSNCPSRVLNIKASHKLIDKNYGGLNFSQPAMSFSQGYCQPNCTKCSQVCPTGAILPISATQKSSIHIGLATWNVMNCGNSQGRPCSACVNVCPRGALSIVENHSGSRQIMVDPELCVGCGACEHICPARPYPAIVVNGLKVHRSLQ